MKKIILLGVAAAAFSSWLSWEHIADVAAGVRDTATEWISSEGSPAEKIAEARKATAALRERADGFEAKERKFLIDAEMRRLEAAKQSEAESKLTHVIEGFVAASRQARSEGHSSFRYNHREYRVADSERQVKLWCADLASFSRARKVAEEAANMYSSAAAKIRKDTAILVDAAGNLDRKVDELETQVELVSVQSEIHAATSTGLGLPKGDVGKAIAGLQKVIDRVVVTMEVDSARLTEVSATDALADLQEVAVDVQVDELARSFLN